MSKARKDRRKLERKLKREAKRVQRIADDCGYCEDCKRREAKRLEELILRSFQRNESFRIVIPGEIADLMF